MTASIADLNAGRIHRTLSPVEALAVLVGRLRDCVREAERLPLQRELTRIADELIVVRTTLLGSEPISGLRHERHPDYRRNATTRAKNPEPGKRCCSRCGFVFPLAMFAISDARTGKRRADCKDCYNESQRTRYVRAGYMIVTIEVLDGDPCVGHPCPICGLPFEVGQSIQSENLRHEDCGHPVTRTHGG